MIHRLQNLSDKTKRFIAFGGAFSLTFVIFAVWIFGFTNKFGSTVVRFGAESKRFYADFEENIGNVYNKYTAKVETNKKLFSASVEFSQDVLATSTSTTTKEKVDLSTQQK